MNNEEIRQILILFANNSWHEAHEDLLWSYVSGELRFHVDCSDVFAWASADAEEIKTTEDIEGLGQARRDLEAIEWSITCAGQWPALWCARKRKMIPQKPYLDRLRPDLRKLFEEAANE